MLSIFLQQFISGFFVKTVASFDDTLTRIPIIAKLTVTVLGKIAFSIGTLLALSTILIFAVFISQLLNLLPFAKVLTAFLIILLAIAVYFDVFVTKLNLGLDKKFEAHDFPHSRFIKLVGIGFIISFITLIDDALVLVPLFIGNNIGKVFAVVGVYTATLVQIAIVIYFGERINKFKYKKELASFALIFLAILIILGVI